MQGIPKLQYLSLDDTRRVARFQLCARFDFWVFVGLLLSATPASAEFTYVAQGGESLWLLAAVYDRPIWQLLNDTKVSESQLPSLAKDTRVRIAGTRGGKAIPTAEQVRRRQEQKVAGLTARADAGIRLLGLGETLWDVSLQYNVKLSRLMKENHLNDKDLLTLAFETPVFVPKVRQADIRQPGVTPPQGIVHTLEPRQTIWHVAEIYQVGVSEILAANQMSEATALTLKAGMRLFVPSVRRTDSGGTEKIASEKQQRDRREAEVLGLGTYATAVRLYEGYMLDDWRETAGPAELMDGTLQWPVRKGHFVRGYGSGAGHYHLAVDIAANIGAKVRAAAPGIVGYADRAIKGYGQMVFLLHPGGWITMYAHNSAIHVVAGEMVDAGDVISEVGSTGLSRGPHVHFELLYDGKNCDPEPLLRPGIRNIKGEIKPPPHPAIWNPSTPRPHEVQCAPRRHYPGPRPEGGRQE